MLTRRTLQRWLDAIVQQYPIECDTRSKPYGYRWMDTAQGLNLPLLTATEALLLQLARSEVGQILPASPTSLLPQAAAEAGIPFAALLDRLIELALEQPTRLQG